jgi:predicted PurR-regulated permease PerM
LTIILLVILGPISYFAYRLATELITMLGRLQGEVRRLGGLQNYVTSLVDTTLAKIGMSGPEFAADIEHVLATTANTIGKELQEKTGEFFRTSLDFFFMAITLFFVLRDGPRALRGIIDRIRTSDYRKASLETEVEDIMGPCSRYPAGTHLHIAHLHRC